MIEGDSLTTRPGRIDPERLADVPMPGGGATWERWRTLASIAADDLVTARLVEGHLDALAIVAELEPGRRPRPVGRLGVWAAEAPRGGMRAMPDDGGGWVLEGTRRWCSGVHEVTTGLVTAHAPDGLRLFLLPCTDHGVVAVPGTWPAVGMADSDSLEIQVDGVRVGPDAVIGGPGAYLERPGFWHGAIGVAACWFGGAVGVGRLLRSAVHDTADPHGLAHLGAVDTVLSTLADRLRTAAAEIDADPCDHRGGAELRARRVRAAVEAGCDEVLTRTGRATGATPLCLDPDHARRVADLTVYLRQSHGDADLARLGGLAARRADGLAGPVIDVGAGTPEPAWSEWLRTLEQPAMEWPGRSGDAVVIVAPHPDDEVLGVGGALRVLHDLGRPVRVVAVTDGEASHPGSQVLAPAELAVVRARESKRAIARLGLRGCPVDRLGLPDGEVSRFEDDLAGKLGALVEGAGLVMATWRHDGHPDHEAAGRAAARAAADAGAAFAEYLVWTWNWARPDDRRVPWDRAHRVPLAPAIRQAKARAIAEFRSQIEPLGPDPEDQPVLPADELAHHHRSFEVLLT